MQKYTTLLNSDHMDFDALDHAIAASEAYSYGSALIGMTLENKSGKSVSITGIRPVNMHRLCLPDGLLILYGSEGGDYVQFTFDLDAARPVAHEINLNGEVDTKPYFDGHPSIEIAAGATLDIDLTFTVARYAYAFDIAFEYVTNGKKNVLVVRRPSGQFLTTASDCPFARDRQTLNEADLARLKDHRYDKIRQRISKTDSAGFLVAGISPDDYSKQCETR